MVMNTPKCSLCSRDAQYVLDTNPDFFNCYWHETQATPEEKKHLIPIEVSKVMDKISEEFTNKKNDKINPPHYKSHPSGIECISITEHYNFNIGNAIKYLWRHNEKGNPLEDLKKAEWYIQREICRLEKTIKE